MKKRVLSALLALCMAGSLAGTVWAAEPGQATPETAQAAEAPRPAAEEAYPEAASTPETEQETAYTAEAEKDGQPLKVTVTATENAFGDAKADAQVEAIEDETALDAVAATLDGAGVEYDGFAALDVKFVDETGAEVEPNEAVQVRFELPEALLAEDADLSTLAIHHLVEDADGNVTAVEPVASVADGDIEVSEALAAAANEAAGIATLALDAEEISLPEDGPEIFDDAAPAEEPALVAEFEVNGFSTFTITWKSEREYLNGTVTVHYVDQNGNEIAGSQTGDISLQNGIWVDLNTYGTAITGYTYQGAHLNSYNGTLARWIKRQYVDKWNYSNSDSTPSGNSGSDWSVGFGDSRGVYLVYNEQGGSTPGGEITSATVTTGKSAVLNDDGTYTLNLSVSGDRGSQNNPAKVDLLLIVDKSGSMSYSMSGSADKSRGRMKAVVDAVESLTGTLWANKNVDVRYNLITFSSLRYTDSDQDTGWVTNAQTINNAVAYFTQSNNNQWSHNLEGGTNYQYAFSKAKTALSNGSVRSDAQQIVIFLTDGIPTHKNLPEQNEERDDGNSDFINTNAAITELNDLNADAFYCIGVGSQFSQNIDENNSENGPANLQRIVNSLRQSHPNMTVANPYSANSTQELQSIFAQIAGSTTFFAASKVVMTDPLSTYAEIVPGTDGNYNFTVTIASNAEGATPQTISVTVPSNSGSAQFTFYDSKNTVQTGTVSYNASNKTITLTLPEQYELEQGYTYSISTVITPSAAAVSAGMNSDAAKQTPDAGTGTHATGEEQGFWSNVNENAKVTYTANGTEGSQLFPKPVIQVQNGSLTIEKKIEGLTDTSLINTLLSNLTFTVKDSSNQTVDITGHPAFAAVTGKDNTYAFTVSNLPAGSYTVTESSGDVSGYTWTTADANKAKTATVPAGGTGTASFTNSYTRTMHTLKLTKRIQGNMASTAEDFEFTVSWNDSSVGSLDGKKTVKDETSQSGYKTENLANPITSDGKFTLKANESIELSVPEGLVVTIDEANGNYTVAIAGATANTTDNSICTVTVDADKTVTYTNTLNITTPPTGLNRNGTPFGVLMAAALVAGVALAGSVVNRRLRRRREE